MKLTMLTFYLILFLSALTLYSCKKLGLCKDQEFTFTRQGNNTVKLRLDGYYYGNVLGNNLSQVEIYLFYENGIFNNNKSGKLQEVEAGVISLDSSELRKTHKSYWGIYKVEGDFLEIQYWEPSTSCLPTMKLNGIVLNDSTFKVTSWKRSGKKETYEVDALFHFKEYSPKPDSVVTFIK